MKNSEKSSNKRTISDWPFGPFPFLISSFLTIQSAVRIWVQLKSCRGLLGLVQRTIEAWKWSIHRLAFVQNCIRLDAKFERVTYSRACFLQTRCCQMLSSVPHCGLVPVRRGHGFGPTFSCCHLGVMWVRERERELWKHLVGWEIENVRWWRAPKQNRANNHGDLIWGAFYLFSFSL